MNERLTLKYVTEILKRKKKKALESKNMEMRSENHVLTTNIVAFKYITACTRLHRANQEVFCSGVDYSR